MNYQPPRVDRPDLTHVGVCILWADDFTHCRARYLDWHVRYETDPVAALDPSYRRNVESAAYLRVIKLSDDRRGCGDATISGDASDTVRVGISVMGVSADG